MDAGRNTRQRQRSALVHNSLGLAVHENLNAIHVSFNNQASEFRRFGPVDSDVGGIVGQNHVRVETAALGGRVLQLLGVAAHVGVHVVRKFVGGDHAVTGCVGLTLQSLVHVIGEDAVSASPEGAFVGLLAVPACGQREH